MIRALLLILLAFLPVAVSAQTLPQPLSDSVSDFAGILSPDQQSRLTLSLQKARKETGVQIVMVTMDFRSQYGGSGLSIETYAKNLFNAWGIGDKKRDDGILILVAKGDREMRIALGRGYDAVYDGVAQRIIDRDMLPAFRENHYADGIQAGAQAVIDRLARPYASHNPPRAEIDYSGLLSMLPYVLFGGLFGGLVLRRQIGDVATRFRRCPRCGQKTLSRNRVVENEADETKAGHGIQTTLCSSCAYSEHDTYSIPQKSSGSSGSSGFGGGSSSGGGASGRW
ncbi:MAG: TPM domain-containing protein [Pseudomonadota bacterium]